ncbi:MAG: class I tRNA ligase family protein, partial [Bacteroidia bacterium]|nr:class I tRNA ligase family protein [Bacteroidia bacterium]
IQGETRYIARLKTEPVFLSYLEFERRKTEQPDLENQVIWVRAAVQVSQETYREFAVLDVDAFLAWRPENQGATFIREPDGKFLCKITVEKMSKSLYNVVNPDEICEQYGADTMRLYEMFLGPLELSKPWNMNGITGVFNFLRKTWNLFTNEQNEIQVTEEPADVNELRLLHQLIKKVSEDIERLSLNTTIPQFMIFVNEMTKIGCKKRAILEPFLICLSPYAPHFCEELWQKLGHTTLIADATFPQWNEAFLKVGTFDYPVSVNGKLKGKLSLPMEISKEDLEKEARAAELIIKLAEGKTIQKVVAVPGKIINLVIQ